MGKNRRFTTVSCIESYTERTFDPLFVLDLVLKAAILAASIKKEYSCFVFWQFSPISYAELLKIGFSRSLNYHNLLYTNN